MLKDAMCKKPWVKFEDLSLNFQVRSDDLRVPSGDQVHVLQVRCVWQHSNARQPLHPPAEHRQREDVHLPLVLVHHTRCCALATDPLQVRMVNGYKISTT
jgi:hypothetical protein